MGKTSYAVSLFVCSVNNTMDRKEETGCQTPEGPILCINNCGFFGSATTAYMCSKCHKEMLLKQHASSSIETLINGSATSGTVTDKNGADSVIGGKNPVIVLPSLCEPKTSIVTLVSSLCFFIICSTPMALNALMIVMVLC